MQKYNFINIFEKIFFGLFWVSLIFWIWFVFIDGYNPLILYYVVWILGFGYLVYKKHVFIEKKIKEWEIQPFYKFIILGYSMVLLEEVVAGIANHLSEPFSIILMIARVFQFQFFNLFAFTGLILGTYIVLKKFDYTKREIFFVAGAYGIFAENIYTALMSNPLALLLLVSPMVYTYGLIMYPAISSINFSKNTLKYKPVKIVKYIFTYLIIFVCSILPVFIMSVLRTYYPFLFPPEVFIPL